MIDGASVARVRDIVGERGGLESSLLTGFGLICAGSADFKLVIRDAVNLLRRILPAGTIGFFWSDASGEMLDAYVEKPSFLSVETWESHQIYIAEDPRNWPTFNENVLAGPVAGYLLPYQTEAFYASRMYAASYNRIGARHILDAVVHSGQRPLGSFLFMRSAMEGAFSARDIGLARTIGALTTLAFQTGRPRAVLMDSTRLSDAGLIVFGRDGEVVFFNKEAHQSLWLLERNGNIPVVGGPDVGFDELAKRYCPEYVEAARGDARVSRRIECSWGDFEVFAEAQGNVTLIRLMQSRPFAYHLAMKLVEWELPPRRMTVCWLALMGLQRKEIAAIAGITLDTVGEHLEAVFKRMNANSTIELLLRVAA